jgi:SAM-dependent methyltransferase
MDASLRALWQSLAPEVPARHRWLLEQTAATIGWRTFWLEQMRLPAAGGWLDVGSGLGALVVEGLLREPSATASAVDVDPSMAALTARAAALAGVSPRLTTRVGDAADPALKLPAPRYALITARYVMQHVPAPVKLLTALRSRLSPGGRLWIIDIDDRARITDPEPDRDAADLLTAVRTVQRGVGGDRTIGGKLPRLLHEAGFSAVAVHVKPWTQLTSDPVVRKLTWEVERRRIEGLRDAILALPDWDQGRWDRATASYAAWNRAISFVMVPEFGVEAR